MGLLPRLSALTRTIRFKLLAGLLALLALSIGVSLYGIWTFERDRYREIAREEALRAAHTLEQALRHAMILNDWEMIRRTVDDVYRLVEPANVGIINNQGRVLASGDPTLLGHRFDFHRAAECVVCHARPQTPPERDVIFLETAAGPVLRNIIKLENSAECRSCHQEDGDNLGVFLYDATFAEVYAMLRTVLFRTILTGAVTFLLVAMLLSLLVGRYLNRPLRRLEEGFNHVGRGDFNHWVEVEAEGEIQDMATQFNVMSQAIKRSFAEIRHKNWETEQLYAFVRRLSQEAEWDRLRRVILELVQDTFQAGRVALLLRRELQEGELTEITWREADDRRCFHREYRLPPPAGELPAWLAQAWEHWRQSPAATPAYSPDRTIALVPLVTQHVNLGLLCLHRPPEQPFRSRESKLLAAVCEQIEVALANARLYRLAVTDSLTGLRNKRYCETALRKLVEAHRQDRHRPFSVLMLDLDHFKRVNDTHGHPVGDEVLSQLAELIRRQLRQDDVACRYGGEEFIVLVTDGPQTGHKIAARLCRAVDEHTFHCAGGLALHNTISIGVAGFPAHGKTVAEVIGAADQALYEAKRAGRNRCQLAGPPTGSAMTAPANNLYPS
ncbi:sensor domain-containing diguanylate cyclase [Desulfurivibrio alkaliphilus]|uniref:diguanylate cyclase n=1 Tax=Desulfurivibrio alkaliphilus (strain DSM 19089 / UNIQEM U267 / AHT2) TaxID=589865 RepID=D6Z439_DESAT|nr:diguanylate cyclase [Desulfurivibrio alkaliphilus]ADH86314.1 diguanylate cyclase [Desulfurivibrio alkaliphilus AHT 2]